MHEGRGTRRSILGALAAVVAGAALGPGQRARAVKDDGARPRPDYGSKELFKLECELLGGTFSEDGIGNTMCQSDQGTVQCDANGNDCWYTPASGPRPPIGDHQSDWPIDQVATNAPPDATHADDDQELPSKAEAQRGDNGKSKSKSKGKNKTRKGKRGKRRRHGKRRR